MLPDAEVIKIMDEILTELRKCLKRRNRELPNKGEPQKAAGRDGGAQRRAEGEVQANLLGHRQAGQGALVRGAERTDRGKRADCGADAEARELREVPGQADRDSRADRAHFQWLRVRQGRPQGPCEAFQVHRDLLGKALT